MCSLDCLWYYTRLILTTEPDSITTFWILFSIWFLALQGLDKWVYSQLSFSLVSFLYWLHKDLCQPVLNWGSSEALHINSSDNNFIYFANRKQILKEYNYCSFCIGNKDQRLAITQPKFSHSLKINNTGICVWIN